MQSLQKDFADTPYNFPKTPALAGSDRVPADGYYNFTWTHTKQQYNDTRYELLEYSHAHSVDWIFQKCWKDRKDSEYFTSVPISKSSIQLAAQDVHSRQMGAYEDMEFFRVRTWTNYGMPGDWSSPIQYKKGANGEYVQFNNWKSVQDQQCQHHTGERPMHMLTDQQQNHLRLLIAHTNTKGLNLGNMSRYEKANILNCLLDVT